jgi:hypothetical protein
MKEKAAGKRPSAPGQAPKAAKAAEAEGKGDTCQSYTVCGRRKGVRPGRLWLRTVTSCRPLSPRQAMVAALTEEALAHNYDEATADRLLRVMFCFEGAPRGVAEFSAGLSASQIEMRREHKSLDVSLGPLL